MKSVRALPPSVINKQRRRAPQHVQAAIDEAAPLTEINHTELEKVLEKIDPSSELYIPILRVFANNARIGKLLTETQLGRPEATDE